MLRLRGWRGGLYWLVALMTALVCGGCVSSEDEPSQRGGAPVAEEDVWREAPWHGAGLRVGTLSQAQGQLPFHVVEPKGVDGIRGIYLPPPEEQRPPELRSVWFVYKSTEYGWVWIGQGPPDVTDQAQRQAGWASMVASNGQPGRAECETTVVRETVPALICVNESEPFGMSEFVENGVQFEVRGPNLTRDELKYLDNTL